MLQSLKAPRNTENFTLYGLEQQLFWQFCEADSSLIGLTAGDLSDFIVLNVCLDWFVFQVSDNKNELKNLKKIIDPYKKTLNKCELQVNSFCT